MYRRLVMASAAMVLAVVGSATAQQPEAPKVNSWSNSKTDNSRTAFQVKPGEKITFSIKAKGAEKYLWLADGKVQDGANGASFQWTVPNKKGMWKILVKTTNKAREKWAQNEQKILKGWMDRISNKNKHKKRFIRDMIDWNVYPEESRIEWIVAVDGTKGAFLHRKGFLRPAGAVIVCPRSTTGWKSEKSLDVEKIWLTTPALGFNVMGDGKWILVFGSYKGTFHGYRWDGKKWVSDHGLVKGLERKGGSSSPAFVANLTGDKKWTLIAKASGAKFLGYYWDRSKWVSDPARVKGLDEAGGGRSSFTILDNLTGDGKVTLINGNGKGTFEGYCWDGGKWVSDPARIAGLGDVGGRSKPGAGFDVFGDKKWTLVAGNSRGDFIGYYWDERKWVKDPSRVVGIGHGKTRGGDTAAAMAYNLRGDKKWVLIAGYEGGSRGFFCDTVSKNDIPLVKDVSFISAATAARIRWNYEKSWNHRVKYSTSKDMSDALWSDRQADSNSADIKLRHLKPATTYYYEVYTYVPWSTDAYSKSSAGSFTTPSAQGYIRLKPGESIQDAVEFLAPEGGIIELLPGTHDVRKTIVIDRSNVVIYGTRESIVKHHNSRGNCFFIPDMGRETADSSLYVENITFRGFKTASGYTRRGRDILIYAVHAKNITIENIYDTSRASRLAIVTGGYGGRSENVYYKNNTSEHSCMYGSYCVNMYQINNTMLNVIGGSMGAMGTELGIANIHVIGNRINGGVNGSITLFKGEGPRNCRNNICSNSQTGIWIGSGINDVLVINNTVTGTAYTGIHSRPQATQRNNLIMNNRIYNNRKHGFCSPTYFGERFGSETILINNVIYNNGGDGVRLDNNFWSLLNVTNNIIIGNKGYGINCTATKSKVVSSYNVVWKNGSGSYNGLSAGTGDVSVDPLFADLTKGDFHLKSKAGRWDTKAKKWVKDTAHSPCIDAGDPKTDYSQEPAPSGGRVNVGAYGNTSEASKSTVR